MNENELNARNQQSIIELKDNSKRSKNLIAIFWILFGVTTIAIISGFNEIQILKKINRGVDVTLEQAEFSEAMQGIIDITQLVLVITTAVLFIFWFQRAYYNVHQFKFIELKYSDSMAVWGWIIPVMSLFVPFRIMTEIWNGTQKAITQFDPSFSLQRPKGSIGLWWTFYLISSILDQVLFRQQLSLVTTQDMLISAQGYFYSHLLELITILMIINIIKRIAQFESKLAQEVIMHDGLIEK